MDGFLDFHDPNILYIRKGNFDVLIKYKKNVYEGYCSHFMLPIVDHVLYLDDIY